MQFVSCARPSAMDDPDPVYKIRSDCQDVATSSAPQSRINRRRELSIRKWEAAFNSQGMVDMTKVLRHIERGGVVWRIRAEVWEFLLGAYSASSTVAERKVLRQSRRERYFKLKAECRALDAAVGSGDVITAPRVNEDGSPADQTEIAISENATDVGTMNDNSTASDSKNETSAALKSKIVQWKLVLHQIGLDVVRTDRVLEFYEDPKNLAKLWDILAVYAWIDEEVGYCQGMSDLCSPMVLLFPDEADAFWCFKCLMHRVRDNFRCINKTMGVQKQLTFLASAMQVIDPKLHKFLEALGGSTYIFAFRMLMVLFRREFAFTDTLRLWEMMWASEYHPELHVFNLEAEATRIVSINPDYRAGGIFAKRNIKYGSPKALLENQSLAVFFVAGILVLLRGKLMKRSHGLDEVVKALNDMSGKIDAYQACKKALKFHKLYLQKLKKQLRTTN